MMNAVNLRPLRTTRLVWPPEALKADLNVDDYVLKPQGLAKSSPATSLIAPCFSVLITPFLMFEFRHVISQLGKWGYLGVFFIEMANNATIMFPTPVQTYTFTLGMTLNPLMIGLIGGIGTSIGELNPIRGRRKDGPSIPRRTHLRSLTEIHHAMGRHRSLPICSHTGSLRGCRPKGWHFAISTGTLLCFCRRWQNAEDHGFRFG